MRISVIIALTCFWLHFAGCHRTDTTPDASNETSQIVDVVRKDQAKKPKRKEIFKLDVSHGLNTRDSFDDPTPELIREQVNNVDWTDPDNEFDVGLRGNYPGSYKNHCSFHIGGSLNPNDPDRAMYVIWSEIPDGEDVWNVFHFRGLKSSDQATELLTSFLKRDDQFRTMVGWEQYQ